MGFYCAGWSWELFKKSQEHPVNASALVTPSHVQALEGLSLERCWYHLHPQRLSTTAEACGGWAGSSSVSGRERFWAHFGEHVALSVPRKAWLTTGGFKCLLLSERWTRKFALLVMPSPLYGCSQCQVFSMISKRTSAQQQSYFSNNCSASHFTWSRIETCLQVRKCCRLTFPVWGKKECL